MCVLLLLMHLAIFTALPFLSFLFFSFFPPFPSLSSSTSVREKQEPGTSHRGVVDRLMYCDAIDKYVTCSRDGTFRLWNSLDLRHYKTVLMGSSWITDTCYMPQVGWAVGAATHGSFLFYFVASSFVDSVCQLFTRRCIFYGVFESTYQCMRSCISSLFSSFSYPFLPFWTGSKAGVHNSGPR